MHGKSLAFGLAFWGLTATAHAKCGLPKLELLWSYPTAGAADVPVNAELWVVVPWAWGSPRPVVRLDGRELTVPELETPWGQFHLQPGALLPEHDYVLQISFPNRQAGGDAGGPQVIEVPFRTGSTAASAPAAPVLGAHSSTEPLFQDLRERIDCPDIHLGQECLDVGPNTAHRWEAEGSAPLAWLVGEHVIPARCGAPQVLMHVHEAVAGCLDVRAIGPGGLTSDATQACRPAPARPVDAPTDAGGSLAPRSDASIEVERATTNDDGCHVAHGGGMGWTLLALLRRRRRR